MIGSCSFFFNDTATTEIYTLSLHDALPICPAAGRRFPREPGRPQSGRAHRPRVPRARRSTDELVRSRRCTAPDQTRSEEHTSELQSRQYLVCRLLLEKKKKSTTHTHQLVPQ